MVRLNSYAAGFRPGRLRRETTRLAGAALCLSLLSGCGEGDTSETNHLVQSDRSEGRRVIEAFECGVCHTIPGVTGAYGIVGPSLAEFGNRSYIGGVLPNRPELLLQWVRDAPDFAPDTAMPDFPTMTERQALDIATYLYTLK